MSTEHRARYYFVASLIASLVGAIMLLTQDFAGWYPYGLSDQYIHLLTNPFYFIIIGGFAALLLYVAYVSYRGLRSGKTTLPPRKLRLGFYAAIIVAAGCLLGGIIFLVYMGIEEPADWWLDSGFYGGVICAGLTALFFRLASRSLVSGLKSER